jgi:hypothetical protein
MSIDLRCGQCGQPYAVPEALVGKVFRCKRCEAVVRIIAPGGTGPASSRPAAPRAPSHDDLYGPDLDDPEVEDEPLEVEALPPRREANPFAAPRAAPRPTARSDGQGTAVASLVLGIVAMVAWCLPILGLPVVIAGLVTGGLGLKTSGRGKAITGIILCSIALVLTLANMALGVYLAIHGIGPFGQRPRR